MSTSELLENTNVEFDPTAVDTVDQETVEIVGPAYPVVQWHTGNPQMKKIGGMDYAGGFFVKADALDESALERAGWSKVSWEHSDGKEEVGYYRREIAVSVIALRKRWEVYSQAEGRSRSYAWKDYDRARESGRPSGRTQALCIVKGLEDQGPIVLTFRGMSALSFEGNMQAPGALSKFAQTIIAAANKQSDEAARKKGTRGGKRWPYRAFWLVVGADRKADGTPSFTEVGKGNSTRQVVLPIALGLPEKPQNVNLARFYVGNELLNTVNEIFAEAEASWTHAWDSIEPEADAETSETATETAEAVPQADNAALESLGL